MLVLSRRVGESIFVGENIVINVLSVQGNRVRVAIEAPRSVNVRRSELADAGPSLAGENVKAQPSRAVVNCQFGASPALAD